MKFTLSWLRDHLETDADVDRITDTLTDLGLEVEHVINPLQRLAGFTVGRVRKAIQHPDADRLRVCTVETDEGDREIVCGAPNAREGIRVVIAKPGMFIPGIDTTINVGKIRGVESHGMMCSERELELSDEHDGIIELSGEPAVGTEFVDWLARTDPGRVDPMIEIAITPNRPDALGVRGIARDLAARGLGTLKPYNIPGIDGGFESWIGVSIDEDVKLRGCPLFAGRLIRGVVNGSSPEWLQARIRSIGLRPISALVDITNYLTYDMNRPLHVFDADVIEGDLRVHHMTEPASILALDDREYGLRPGMIAISDQRGPESIAGIMGGAGTCCTGNTVNVFLESALWDPVMIAATGRKLKILSDARYRFERGVDPEFALPGLDVGTGMILDICGGEPSNVVMDGAVPDTGRSYRLDTNRVKSLVGMDIPESVQRATLEALGFRMDRDHAHPPSWRPDVCGDADLVEEVARIASLADLKGTPMPRPRAGVPEPVLTLGQRREIAARRGCASLGYHECVTYSFIEEAAARLFGGGDDVTKLENPISSEMSHLRPDLLPGLLQAAARNQTRGFTDFGLFEVGPVFHGGEPGDECMQVGGILVGHSGPKDVHASRRTVDVFDAKADATAILGAVGAPEKVQILRGGDKWWHPGRHGTICLGARKVLAVFGQVHPAVLRALDVNGPVVGFSIWLDRIPERRRGVSTRAALTNRDLQAVERDFAFVVDAGVEAQTVVNAARSVNRELIDDVRVFDEFPGPDLGRGKKSLAISVRLQPVRRTLTDQEIEAVGADIVEKVRKATGGFLRR